MYFVIDARNGEIGISVEDRTSDNILEAIADDHGVEIENIKFYDREAGQNFLEAFELRDRVLLIKGDIVVPKPIEKVVSWVVE